MTTVTIQIGNTDNKLTQQDWSKFVSAVDDVVHRHAKTTHFSGGSAANAPWQNYCWVCQITSLNDAISLSLKLRDVATEFHQDSIALTKGDTILIERRA